MRFSLRFDRLWSNIGLRAKMTLIVIIGVVSMVTLFAYLGTAALEDNIQRTLQERVVLAQTTARHMDYVIASIEDDLTDISGQYFASLDASLLDRAFQRMNFYATRVFLLDRRARAVAAHPPITSTLSFEEFSAVSAVLTGRPFAVSRFLRPLDPLGASTIAATPIRDSSGQIIGALAISINLTSPNLPTFTRPIGLGETGYMDLIDLGGVILASTRSERIGMPSDHGSTLAEMIRARRPDVSTCHDCHTTAPQPVRREVIAFAPLDRAQWGVAVRQSDEEVFASTRQLQTRIFALMLIMLAGALVLVYLTTQSVVAPVQSLTTATKRIAQGDLETPIRSEGRDEIGTLAQSFDVMRARLKQSIAEIQEWNRELETRVLDGVAAYRTALEENRRLYAELERKEQMRGELLHRLISAQEEERKRIARELHDETSQILTSLAYTLDLLSEETASGATSPTDLQPLLQKMRAQSEAANTSLHRIIFALRPTLLDHLGLLPALRSYAETRFNGSGVECAFHETGNARRLPPETEIALFRVTQEAINNIAQHARARRADFHFHFADHHLQVRIRDDGVGFDAAELEAASDGKRGLGLLGMQERIAAIGGEFHLDSKPGAGTTIRLDIPIP